MIRLSSPLSDEAEERVSRLMGCCIRVRHGLGPGLLEHTYARAACIELDVNGLRFEKERRISVCYRGQFLCYQRLDLVVEDQIVVELKSVDRLAPVHLAQIRSYLRASGLRIGLLVNFNVPILPDGLKRVVL